MTDRRPFDLADGQALHLDDARGSTLRVVRGQLWVTQDRDPRDIVLEAGEAWTIERDGLTLATAQRDSVVVLAGTAAAKLRADGRRRSWSDRFAAWLEGLAVRNERRHAPYL